MSLGLAREHPVGRLQVLGAGRLSQGGPQAAALGHGGGDVVLGAVARLMVLVGQQVLGHLGPPHGRAHDAVASQADLQAIPVHGAPAEDPGQGPERHAEGAEEQRVADLVGVAGHVGQDEAGPDGEGAAGLAADAAQADAQLGGGAGVLEAIAAGERPGEELRPVAEGTVQPVAESSRVGDDAPVGGFVDGQTDGRTGSGQESPPRCAGYTKGDSWPSSYLFATCTRAHEVDPPQTPGRSAFSPWPDRRRMSLPEVHRLICDWLRIEAAREWLSREFMTVPEQLVPA